ncbi:DUF6790 family protein [Streptomyces sp. NPDC051658]|uniref:DUF6790 family protein n=1 Tax=Streptomyces sp. NPDC051658 TaxID=3365667 RepID=UPI0037B337CE
MLLGLAAAAFLWGATIGHVYQWFANGDHAAGNTGGILANDVLIPAALAALAALAARPPGTSGTFAEPARAAATPPARPPDHGGPPARQRSPRRCERLVLIDRRSSRDWGLDW